MTATWNRGERPAAVHVRLERELQRRLASGILKPGDRLPSAAELGLALSAHPITIQKALRRLKDMGVVSRIPKLGTFVRPGQDRFRTAVLFGPSLTDETAYFYRALLAALRRETPHPGWQCYAYDGLNDSAPVPSEAIPAFRHFLADRDHDGFRGYIGIGLADTRWERIRRESGLAPHVRFGQGCEVDMDYGHFGRSAAEVLLGAGCRKIAYLRTLTGSTVSDLEAIRQVLAGRPGGALEVVQLPLRGPHYDERRDAEFCLRLVRDWNRARRWPEAILISDDVSMRGLAHALVSCGPERLEQTRVVTWSNKGIRLHYGFPVVRYETDLADCASALTGLLFHRLNGEAIPNPGLLIRGKIVEPSPRQPRLAEQTVF
jgi:DNA-binding transcriptional regulator YhcF (GntR family)